MSRGRIRSLEIENFKSFKGKEVIEFSGFTSVVGPNGAGKSNLMDAVSFVLGIHSRHLRSSKLIELLHKGPGGASRGSRRATVALTYERPGGEAPIVFSRTISPVGVGASRRPARGGPGARGAAVRRGGGWWIASRARARRGRRRVASAQARTGSTARR